MKEDPHHHNNIRKINHEHNLNNNNPKKNIDLSPDKSFDNKKGKYVQSKTTLSSSNNKFNEC